jgi:type VI protein secretion system component Hcp
MSPITPKPGPDHSTDISLSSMRWGASSTTTVGSVSSGAGAGKPTLAPFTVTKVLDKTSPLFFKTAVTGTHTQQATIYVLPPAGQGSKGEALEFVLKTVVVGSDQQHATTTGSAETINLVYQSAFEDYLRNGKVVGTS